MPAKTNTSTPALDGYDPVAYFTEGRPVPGSEEFLHQWGGRPWRFKSAENRDAFAANPEQYAPQYDGRCAFAMSLGKDNAPAGSPRSWRITDGKLYLALNPVAGFLMRVLPNRIAGADRHWANYPGRT